MMMTSNIAGLPRAISPSRYSPVRQVNSVGLIQTPPPKLASAPQFSGWRDLFSSGPSRKQLEFVQLTQSGTSAYRSTGLALLQSVFSFNQVFRRNWDEPFSHSSFYRYFSDQDLKYPYDGGRFPQCLNDFARPFEEMGLLRIVESKGSYQGLRFQTWQLTSVAKQILEKSLLEDPLPSDRVDELKALFEPNSQGLTGMEMLNYLQAMDPKAAVSPAKNGFLTRQLFPSLQEWYAEPTKQIDTALGKLRELGLVKSHFIDQVVSPTFTTQFPCWSLDEKGKRLLANKDIRATFKLEAQDYAKVVEWQVHQKEALITAKAQALSAYHTQIQELKATLPNLKALRDAAKQEAIAAYEAAQLNQDATLALQKETESEDKLAHYHRQNAAWTQEAARCKDLETQLPLLQLETEEAIHELRQQIARMRKENAIEIAVKTGAAPNHAVLIDPADRLLELQAAGLIRKQLKREEIDSLRASD